jgi:quinolinate synthase
LSLDDCVVYDPHRPMGGLTPEQLRRPMILWRGHCSVHGRFTVEAVEAARRATSPASRSSCTPSAVTRSVELADDIGSTEQIIKTIAAAPAGTAWVVGTELNLVKRLAARCSPSSQIAFLEKNVCYCSTMNRIDLPHLVWALESLVEGRVVNPIRVDPEVAPTGPEGGARPDACPARRGRALGSHIDPCGSSPSPRLPHTPRPIA